MCGLHSVPEPETRRLVACGRFHHRDHLIFDNDNNMLGKFSLFMGFGEANELSVWAKASEEDTVTWRYRSQERADPECRCNATWEATPRFEDGKIEQCNDWDQ